MAQMRCGSGRPWAAAPETISCSSGRRSQLPAGSSRSYGPSTDSRSPTWPNGEAPGQVDRWLLGELDLLVKKATEAMDRFQFDETFKAIRAFAWEVLADNYIELVKARLYGPDSPEKRAAQNALYTAIETVWPDSWPPSRPSSQRRSTTHSPAEACTCRAGPKAMGFGIDPAGLAIKEIAAALRRYKAEKGMALNAPLPGIVVYSDLGLETADHGRSGQLRCGEQEGQAGDRDASLWP